MEVRKLVNGTEYILVKKLRLLPDVVLFERKKEGEKEIVNVSYWNNGKIIDFAEWWMEDYYCSFPSDRCHLIKETKKLWDEIKDIGPQPWPRPDINTLNAENPEDLIRKSDYAILYVDHVTVSWYPSDPRMSRAEGEYRIIKGRWYEETMHGSVVLYPLTEGEVEILRKVETSMWKWVSDASLSLVPIARKDHLVCQSIMDLPRLRIECHEA